MSDDIERARQIAAKVLTGQYDPLLACRDLIDIRDQLPITADEVMNVFRAVDSEIDGLPIGPERAYWNADSLRVKDLQAANYRAAVRDLVEEALLRLLEATEDDEQS